MLARVDRDDRDIGKERALEAPLSALGRSVLMMLQATREPEFERLPMSMVVAAVAASKGSDAEIRENALAEFERKVGFRRHLFAGKAWAGASL